MPRIRVDISNYVTERNALPLAAYHYRGYCKICRPNCVMCDLCLVVIHCLLALLRSKATKFCSVADCLHTKSDVDDFQYGFTAKHYQSLYTSVMKQTVGYYRSRGSHVFACFVDIKKASW